LQQQLQHGRVMRPMSSYHTAAPPFVPPAGAAAPGATAAATGVADGGTYAARAGRSTHTGTVACRTVTFFRVVVAVAFVCVAGRGCSDGSCDSHDACVVCCGVADASSQYFPSSTSSASEAYTIGSPSSHHHLLSSASAAASSAASVAAAAAARGELNESPGTRSTFKVF
jgi:hypothetical protein